MHQSSLTFAYSFSSVPFVIQPYCHDMEKVRALDLDLRVFILHGGHCSKQPRKDKQIHQCSGILRHGGLLCVCARVLQLWWGKLSFT